MHAADAQRTMSRNRHLPAEDGLIHSDAWEASQGSTPVTDHLNARVIHVSRAGCSQVPTICNSLFTASVGCASDPSPRSVYDMDMHGQACHKPEWQHTELYMIRTVHSPHVANTCFQAVGLIRVIPKQFLQPTVKSSDPDLPGSPKIKT